MKHTLYTVIGCAALLGTLAAPAVAVPSSSNAPAVVAQAGIPDHVHHIWEGIRHARWCRHIIDSDSGTDYGGHREQAERNIDFAIHELERCVEYYRVSVVHTAAPYRVPPVQLSEPGLSHWDHLHRIREGIRHLEHTRRIIDDEAGTNYGGHRERAEEALNHAIYHLHEAEEFFHHHHHEY